MLKGCADCALTPTLSRKREREKEKEREREKSPAPSPAYPWERVGVRAYPAPITSASIRSTPLCQPGNASPNVC